MTLKEMVKKHGMSQRLMRSLICSNPKLPIAYGVPKIHKPENKMRLIIRYSQSPIDKVSKWVVKEINKLNYPQGFSINNSMELSEKLKEMEIEEDEVLVSFDVTSMFPSIPIEESLKLLKVFLASKDITEHHKEIIYTLLRMCMYQKIFQFRDKFYEQKSGAAIGNAASCLVSNLVMDHLERKVKFKRSFPKFYCRYVDDSLGIMKRNLVHEFLKELNSIYPSINFTLELEADGKLPFLDLLLIRRGKKIEMEIYRKPTDTNLLIKENSFHPFRHKNAAIHSMVHRMINIPLSVESYKKELMTIIKIAQINGYSESLVMKIVKNHQKKKVLRDITTLSKIHDESNCNNFMSTPYCGNASIYLSNTLKKFGIKLTFTNPGQLKDLLSNPKDKENDKGNKSGIYKLFCVDGCQATYIGETRRQVIERFKEHLNDEKKAANPDSAMAYHSITEGHQITRFEILKEMNVPWKLDAYESLYLYLHRNGNLVNNQRMGNLPSILYQICEEI